MKALKNKKGMTMVNVIIAFAMMVIMVLMFTQVASFSNRILAKSDDIKAQTEKVVEEYCKGSSNASLVYNGSGDSGLKLTDGTKSFNFDCKIYAYQAENITLYSFGERRGYGGE